MGLFSILGIGDMILKIAPIALIGIPLLTGNGEWLGEMAGNLLGVAPDVISGFLNAFSKNGNKEPEAEKLEEAEKLNVEDLHVSYMNVTGGSENAADVGNPGRANREKIETTGGKEYMKSVQDEAGEDIAAKSAASLGGLLAGKENEQDLAHLVQAYTTDGGLRLIEDGRVLSAKETGDALYNAAISEINQNPNRGAGEVQGILDSAINNITSEKYQVNVDPNLQLDSLQFKDVQTEFGGTITNENAEQMAESFLRKFDLLHFDDMPSDQKQALLQNTTTSILMGAQSALGNDWVKPDSTTHEEYDRHFVMSELENNGVLDSIHEISEKNALEIAENTQPAGEGVSEPPAGSNQGTAETQNHKGQEEKQPAQDDLGRE